MSSQPRALLPSHSKLTIGSTIAPGNSSDVYTYRNDETQSASFKTPRTQRTSRPCTDGGRPRTDLRGRIQGRRVLGRFIGFLELFQPRHSAARQTKGCVARSAAPIFFQKIPTPETLPTCARMRTRNSLGHSEPRWRHQVNFPYPTWKQTEGVTRDRALGPPRRQSPQADHVSSLTIKDGNAGARMLVFGVFSQAIGTSGHPLSLNRQG